MTTAIKRRRGTTAQHSTFTGLEGELTIDTTKDTVVVHDGATAGGFPLAKETGSAIAATTLSASGAFSANGGATLGDASGDALTINSSAVSIPNGLNFDSNTFVIDATNNRVGVGVASPAKTLDVGGLSDFRASLNLTAGAIFVPNDSGMWMNGYASYGSGITSDSVGTAVRLWTSGSERMRITSTGNVGIGTSSPSVKLQVFASSIPEIRIQSGSYQPAISFYTDNSTSTARNWAIIADNNAYGDLTFQQSNALGGNPITAGTTRMTIDSSGNLGLGVTPSAWGSLKALELANGVAFGSYTGGSQAISYFTNNAYFNGTNWIYKVSGSNAVLQNMPYTGGVNWQLAPSGTAGNAITFTQAMTLDASGNLGIGTTAPYNRVEATTSGGATVGIANSDSGSNILYGKLAFYSTVAAGAYKEYGGQIRSYSGVGIDYGDLRFYTGNGAVAAERMRIDSSGNVGIGSGSVSTTGDRLSVYGAAGAGGGEISMSLYDNTTGYSFKMLRTGGTYGYAGIGSNEAALYTYSSNMTFCVDGAYAVKFATNGSERMRINSSGNVGIGTSSPSEKLQIVGTGDLKAELQTNSTNGAAFRWKNASYSYLWQLYSGAFRVYDETAGTERMRIDSSGALLVGCTGGGGSAGVSRFYTDTTGDSMKIFNVQASSSSYTLVSAFSNASTPSNPTGTLRFNLLTNGGIQNYSANNSNLSDIREKTDIELAGSYLDKICSIPVKTFNYIDQGQDDAGKTLGVIAQDVEAVAPELVTESNWGTKEEPKMRLSIYQTDLQYALMKCIQELKAEVDSLKAQLNK